MQFQQPVTLKSPSDHPFLHGMVSSLIDDAAPLAVHNRNFIVNNVPADLQLETNRSIIAGVLNNLFYTAVRNAQNSVILVSARVYGQAVLVQLKSKGNVSPGLAEEIRQACLNAQKTGGVIELTHFENEEASIAYCFLNIAGQA